MLFGVSGVNYQQNCGEIVGNVAILFLQFFEMMFAEAGLFVAFHFLHIFKDASPCGRKIAGGKSERCRKLTFGDMNKDKDVFDDCRKHLCMRIDDFS